MTASIPSVVGSVGRSPFLLPPQRVAAAVALGTGVIGTAAFAAAVGQGAGPLAATAIVGAQCVLADPLATIVRHPRARLAWEFWGREGHIFGVAAGLALTFGALASLFDADALRVVSEASRSNISFGAKLFVGIQPWVTLDALLNPAHKGRRWNVLARETVRNLAGSLVATVAEPIAGSLIDGTLGRIGAFWRALGVQATTVVGYLAVLTGGWGDYGAEGLSDAERAENGV